MTTRLTFRRHPFLRRTASVANRADTVQATAPAGFLSGALHGPARSDGQPPVRAGRSPAGRPQALLLACSRYATVAVSDAQIAVGQGKCAATPSPAPRPVIPGPWTWQVLRTTGYAARAAQAEEIKLRERRHQPAGVHCQSGPLQGLPGRYWSGLLHHQAIEVITGRNPGGPHLRAFGQSTAISTNRLTAKAFSGVNRRIARKAGGVQRLLRRGLRPLRTFHHGRWISKLPAGFPLRNPSRTSGRWFSAPVVRPQV